MDVAKDKLDIYIQATKAAQTIKNDVRTVGSWLKAVQKEFDIAKVVLEPTGGYEDKLLQQLDKNNINTFFIHPNKLFFFKKSKGEKAKTDYIDTVCMLDYALVHEDQLKPANKVHLAAKEIKELVRTRRQINKQMHSYRCYAEQKFYSKGAKQHNRKMIKMLKAELEKINIAIVEAIERDEEKKKNVELLKTITGIGDVTANTFVASVPELGNIDNNRLSSLIGVAPFNNDSGKNKGKRTIKGGRADVRAVLYMAALVAIKHSNRMKAVYDRIVAGGKAKKIAIVAVMRHLLRIMNAVVRDQTKYDPSNGLTAQKA